MTKELGKEKMEEKTNKMMWKGRKEISTKGGKEEKD